MPFTKLVTIIKCAVCAFSSYNNYMVPAKIQVAFPVVPLMYVNVGDNMYDKVKLRMSQM